MAYYRILVVERDWRIASALERILSRNHYEVVIAEMGREALGELKRRSFDLVLTAAHLPDMRGSDLFEASRKLLSEAIWILLVEAADDFEATLPSRESAGFYQFLPKPFEARMLLKMVENALQNRENLRALSLLEAELEAKTRELIEQNKELRRLHKEKKDFLTITSHELKTPATLIAGYADLILMQERLFGEEAELVKLLREGISWLTNIVDDLLEGLRIDAREVQLARSPLLLGEVVRSALRWLKPLIERDRSLSIVADIPETLPPLHADRDRLREVFVNLVGNAVKFTPDGGKIEIGAHEAEGYCHIFVRDTGIGIPEAELERIFDRFHRIGDPMCHSSSKTAFMGGGIGLGLTICRGIIQAHGGLIWAESEGEGKGATFRFTLPFGEKRG